MKNLMQSNRFIAVIGLLLFAAAPLVVTTQAAEYFLRAGVTTMTMPDGVVVTMWGFAKDTSFGSLDGVVTVPGPALELLPGDTTLTIHLDNNLAEPVSVVIPGQAANYAPVRSPNGRIRSFTQETAPGNAAPVNYVWTNMKPGTYAYESGSHVGLQVQMGLYGALKVDYLAGQSYNDPRALFTHEITLLFSEVDSDLHAAVASNNYGPGKTMQSTIDSYAKYGLINGLAYPNSATPIPIGLTGDRVLIRYLNLGVEARVPIIQDGYVTVLAEDGNLTPYSHDEYALFMAAGKTKDVIFIPRVAGTFPVYDRRLLMANRLQGPGGMLAYLSVTAGAASTLTVNFAGPGSGSVSSQELPPRIICPTVCSAIYPAGSLVTLTAIPASRSVFIGWSQTGCLGNGDCTFAINGNTTVTATFNLDPDHIGVFRAGTFYTDKTGDGVWTAGVDGRATFGLATDIPVAGDWNGDGATEIGIFRNGIWQLDMNGNGRWDGTPIDAQYTFGQAGDRPVVGDWSGNHRTKIGIFRNGVFQLDYNGNGVFDGRVTDRQYSFGSATALPVAGDWTGTGADKIGVFLNGVWTLDLNGNGVYDGTPTDAQYTFGLAGDRPVTGDWTGDTRDKIGFLRGATWYLDINGNGVWDGATIDRNYNFGLTGDRPIAGKWYTMPVNKPAQTTTRQKADEGK